MQSWSGGLQEIPVSHTLVALREDLQGGEVCRKPAYGKAVTLNENS